MLKYPIQFCERIAHETGASTAMRELVPGWNSHRSFRYNQLLFRLLVLFRQAQAIVLVSASAMQQMFLSATNCVSSQVELERQQEQLLKARYGGTVLKKHAFLGRPGVGPFL